MSAVWCSQKQILTSSSDCRMQHLGAKGNSGMNKSLHDGQGPRLCDTGSKLADPAVCVYKGSVSIAGGEICSLRAQSVSFRGFLMMGGLCVMPHHR